MASILDILGGGNPLGAVLDTMTGPGGLGSVLGGGSQRGGTGGGFGGLGSGGMGGLGDTIGSVLSSIADKAGNAATSVRDATPGGMGGLMGAGALGAVLGNLLSGNAVKGIALAGASAVAWNFYKKWTASNAEAATLDSSSPATGAAPGGSNQFGDPANALPPADNDVSELVMRSMVYAARADGTIQPEEKARIDAVMTTMLPGADTKTILAKVSAEPLDPATIAKGVKSHEQAEDVYRLSCATIDIDHFMERGYLDALAKSLGIDENSRKEIEAEAEQAKRQLQAAIPR
ncbi:MAG: DUF533 domain-containing protein [Desulfovibrio sp.]|nr:DUF533 domain-containing protein [Desulfovibrio sp.]